MNKSIRLFTEKAQILLTFNKKYFPKKFYTQSFIKIEVFACDSSEGPTYEMDLDDNYVLTHFENLDGFFSYLQNSSKNYAENMVRFIDSKTISFAVREEDAPDEEETIELSRIFVLPQSQNEPDSSSRSICGRPKTKAIEKKEKFGPYRVTDKKQGRQQRTSRRSKGLKRQSHLMFSLEGEEPTQPSEGREYVLDQEHIAHTFVRGLDQLAKQEFIIYVQELHYDHMVVEVACTEKSEPNLQLTPTRHCLFGKAYGSDLGIEDGHRIAVSLEAGEVVIRNRDNNNGKLFDALYWGKEEDWNCHIWVGLKP